MLPRAETPDPIWKRVVGGLVGLALLALMILVVGRSGLSRETLADYGEALVIAPFFVAGVILLYLRQRQQR